MCANTKTERCGRARVAGESGTTTVHRCREDPSVEEPLELRSERQEGTQDLGAENCRQGSGCYGRSHGNKPGRVEGQREVQCGGGTSENGPVIQNEFREKGRTISCRSIR